MIEQKIHLKLILFVNQVIEKRAVITDPNEVGTARLVFYTHPNNSLQSRLCSSRSRGNSGIKYSLCRLRMT